MALAEKEPMESGNDPIVIKKYANRRLYNTAKSSYVTLEDLAVMVREGHDFVVRDAKSGDDITRSVLAQIIFEEEAKGTSMLPATFLRQLIRLYGDTLQAAVPTYLEASMARFLENQETMRKQLRAAFEVNPALANLESITRSNMEWFENTMRVFAPFSGVTKPGSVEAERAEKATAQSVASRDPDLEEMKSQLERMQRQLDHLEGGKGGAGPKN